MNPDLLYYEGHVNTQLKTKTKTLVSWQIMAVLPLGPMTCLAMGSWISLKYNAWVSYSRADFRSNLISVGCPQDACASMALLGMACYTFCVVFNLFIWVGQLITRYPCTLYFEFMRTIPQGGSFQIIDSYFKVRI